MIDLKNKKIGVALGGGGSRAISHLGVLAVLAEAGIKIDCISGSSMGGVIGAMYALSPDAASVKQKAFDYFSGSSLFGLNPKPARNDGLHKRHGIFGWLKKYIKAATLCNLIALRKSICFSNPVEKAVNDLIPEGTNFKDTKIPFAANAINLEDGHLESFTSGELRPVLKAGTSVGVVFPPYILNGKKYVDAAPLSSVPVRACRKLGADIVIAVDIRTPIPDDMHIQNGFDVISRIEMIESRTINDAESNEADILVKPNVGGIFWGDFTNLATVLAAGEAAMKEKLIELKLDQLPH